MLWVLTRILPPPAARPVDDREAGVGGVAGLVALERLDDHAVVRHGARVEAAARVRVDHALPDDRAGGLVERRQRRGLRRGGADVDEPVADRGRADDARALERVAALAALAQ